MSTRAKKVPLSIRAAEKQDVPLLVDFIRELAAHEGRPEVATISATELDTLLFGSDALASAYLGFVDNAAAAYAIVAERFSSFRGTRFIYIEDMLVRPAFRGGGTGLQLLSFLAREVVRRNFDRLEWSALDDNEVALGFYDYVGADREAGVVHYALRGDALLKLVSEADD